MDSALSSQRGSRRRWFSLSLSQRVHVAEGFKTDWFSLSLSLSLSQRGFARTEPRGRGLSIGVSCRLVLSLAEGFDTTTPPSTRWCFNHLNDIDKSWMTLFRKRLSQLYIDGVNSFVDFAMKKVDKNGRIRCPCNDCMNLEWHTVEVVKNYLVRHGMMLSYKNWVYRRELVTEYQNQVSYLEGDIEMSDKKDDQDKFSELLQDYCTRAYMGHDWEDDTAQSEEMHNIDKLLEAAQREVYPGCKKYTLLKFVSTLLHVKVMSKWTNKSFNMLMEILLDLLPERNLVPKSIYEAEKFLRDLGLGYETIHACQHDCALFWKENATLENFSVCGESRYKLNDGNGKKIPHKILRYFPLTPRLRRLYMSRKTATDMRWHSEKRMNDGVLRHPADSSEWKDFDSNFPDFARESRNV